MISDRLMTIPLPARFFAIPLFLSLLIAAGCTTTARGPLRPMSEQSQFLVDPRLGFESTPSRSDLRRFERAWSAFRRGDLETAERGFQDLLRRDPDYGPAMLGLAAVALEGGQIDRAESMIAQVSAEAPESYLAARIYEAELAWARHDPERAYSLYRELTRDPQAPTLSLRRLESIRVEALQELLAAARGTRATGQRREILQRALSIDPQSFDARLFLVHSLIEDRRFDDARSEIQPLLDRHASRDAVQAALAEIDVGKGRYQEAIQRYERLVRTSGGREWESRLEQVKTLWHEANLPDRYRSALESAAVTRTELAILSYWKVPAVRFARNLGQPPIAVDVADVEGREELVRALALGLFPVDRLTRRAEPSRPVTAARLLEVAAAILELAPQRRCESAPGEPQSPVEMLRSCGISVDSLAAEPNRFVSGRTAAALLQQIARVHGSAEE